MLSNFIGLAIVVAYLQFFQDVKSIYSDDDGFIKKRLSRGQQEGYVGKYGRREAAAFSARGDFRPRTPALGEEGVTILFLSITGLRPVQTGGGTPTYMFSGVHPV